MNVLRGVPGVLVPERNNLVALWGQQNKNTWKETEERKKMVGGLDSSSSRQGQEIQRTVSLSQRISQLVRCQ